MKTIYIKTQRELDNLIKKGVQKDEEVYIKVDNLTVTASFDVWGFLEITGKLVWGSSSAVLWGSSRAVLWESSSAVLRESSSAVLWESSSAELRESSRAELRGSSRAVLWGSSSAVLRESSSAVLWESSSAELRESSRAELRESSRAELRESSRAELRESSHAVLRESSSAVLQESSSAVLWGSSSAVLWGSSSAVLQESSSAVLWGSSRAELWGSSVSWVYSDNVIVNLFGFAVAYAMGIEAKIIRKHKTATIIEVPNFKGSWEEYEQKYPVKVTKSKAILYKMVHKNKDGVYFSDHNKDYLYKIGETYKEKNAPKEEGSCASGIHVAHKSWALSFGSGWSDGALLECSVDTKNIVVAQDCDGKVRASEVLVVREVPKDEWYTLDFID